MSYLQFKAAVQQHYELVSKSPAVMIPSALLGEKVQNLKGFCQALVLIRDAPMHQPIIGIGIV